MRPLTIAEFLQHMSTTTYRLCCHHRQTIVFCLSDPRLEFSFTPLHFFRPLPLYIAREIHWQAHMYNELRTMRARKGSEMVATFRLIDSSLIQLPRIE